MKQFIFLFSKVDKNYTKLYNEIQSVILLFYERKTT